MLKARGHLLVTTSTRSWGAPGSGDACGWGRPGVSYMWMEFTHEF